ncbi:MAG TPA: patatin-like phospholipase family protein [Anaerolineae bacterium]|nr:patatin-like phospholipase family protein [Anaerolineae bacterium]
MSRKLVGLVMSGGGARGMAHVGVIRVLEREGIPIDCVAGTSVGSLVGAAYAAGIRGHSLLEMALSVRWREIARFSWPRQGFISFDRLESYLVNLLGDLTFADLDLPYAAVTADLATGEQVVLKEGRVARAVRASCSVPGLVIPVEVNGRLLVDGGVINNLPISVVRALGADVVIAVGLGAPPGTYPKNPLEMATAALDSLLMHAADDPATADVHLPIPVHGFSSLVRTSHRHRYVSLGQQTAERALPAIKASLE